MSEISEIEPASKFRCGFCQKDFRKESTMVAHLCEPKRRHRERDEVGVQLGLQAYLKFYEIAQGSARLKSWDDFSTSSYYRAFVKFGRYCQSIRAVNYPALITWLIRKNVPLDRWCRDQIYQEYLIQHTRQETVNDALARAIESSIEWGQRNRNPSADYLRYGNDNVICHDITRGKITAWAIYNSESGQEFLGRINSDQVSLIWSWIDSDVWQKKFQDFPADQVYAQEILRQAGW
jgi:hypothetical protein